MDKPHCLPTKPHAVQVPSCTCSTAPILPTMPQVQHLARATLVARFGAERAAAIDEAVSPALIGACCGCL